MPKKCCECGAEYGKDPVVITITSCNRKRSSLRNRKKIYHGGSQDNTLDDASCDDSSCERVQIRGERIERGAALNWDSTGMQQFNESTSQSDMDLERKPRPARERKQKVSSRKSASTSPEKIKCKPCKRENKSSDISVDSNKAKPKSTSASTSAARSRKCSPQCSPEVTPKSSPRNICADIVCGYSSEKKGKAAPVKKEKKQKARTCPTTCGTKAKLKGSDDYMDVFTCDGLKLPHKITYNCRSSQTGLCLGERRNSSDGLEKKKKLEKSAAPGKREKKQSACLTICRTGTVKEPADNDLMLPVLIPRYHGPGCTMELDVLEKHDNMCRYKKTQNPERSRHDDRSGSFEVIGRIVFKTCQAEAAGMRNMHDAARMKKGYPQNSRLSAIYSLFQIPCDFEKLNDIKLSTSKSERQIEALKNHIRYKKVLENLIQSGKSFPNNTSDSSSSDKASCSRYNKPDELYEMDYGTSVKSYELEELYISKKKESEKSITLPQPYKYKQKQKKWFYLLFSCLSSDDSYTNMFHSRSDTSYACNQYN